MNNAGLMNNSRKVDEDGLEGNFCVNTLGKEQQYHLHQFRNRLTLVHRDLHSDHQTCSCLGTELSPSSSKDENYSIPSKVPPT